MVATGQPLAAQAGLRALQVGGNAIDAAVATAVALSVLEPTANGIGGDAFALIWTNGQLYGINASGPAGSDSNPEALREAGFTTMPVHGGIPITVPGTPSAWTALSKRWGRLSLSESFADAIEYADAGFPVAPTTAYAWASAFRRFSETFREPMFHAWFETFCPQGRAPIPGEIVHLPGHARTLHQIAADGAEGFYRGELASLIVRTIAAAGGSIGEADLAAYRPEWVEPIHVNYRGYDVWELPPNGHGIVALMALNLLKGFSFDDRDTVYTYHRQIEAIKLAFADAATHVADPRSMRITVGDMLSDTYADKRRMLIREDRASLPFAGQPDRGGTVYLCTADGDGNMVSYIQSNYMGFGSGIVVPGTGISLHNRGANFSLEPGHPNEFAERKRPYHTIIPGFLTRDGKPIGPFGVMGGFMQPQGHVQMVMNTIDFGLNPQASLDAPRWEWHNRLEVGIEACTSRNLIDDLSNLGHEVSSVDGRLAFGRGQIIWRGDNGTLCGGSEPRTDGMVAVW
jgi:gamma-glutamyltranspeptidase/glutathione hydrolase